MPIDDRLARLLLEDNIVTRLKQAEGDIDLLQKLATIKSVDLQTLPVPGTTNPPQAVNPGGWDKSVQYNDGGLFGGDVNFTWDKTLQVLTVNATITSPEATGLSVSGGDGAATGSSDGGTISLLAGEGGATAGDGGGVEIQGGAAQATDGNGGDVNITPGAGIGTGDDGIVTINGDVHFENDNMIWDKTAQTLTMVGSGAPNIQGTEATGMLIYGGAAVTADTIGGTAAMGGGAGDGTGAGGEVGLVGGAGGATAPGGDVYLTGGFGGATSGAGGAVALEGGSALTSGNGGDVTLSPGAGAGAGVNGIVSVSNSDLHILGAGATGLVLYDATLAAYYRITLDNGVLIITAV